MLRSETLFGKREPNTPNPPLGSSAMQSSSMPGASKGGTSAVGNPAGHSLNNQPGHSVNNPMNPNSQSATSSTNEVGSKLIVGPNIKLKGVEITDCDTLVVEGRVEATMESRVLQIAEPGAFNGSAKVDFAEIRGEFKGDLTVFKKLVIYSTGKVTGKLHYGKIVIEEGGQLVGEVQVGTDGSEARNNLSVARTI